MATEWFYSSEGRKHGPISSQELRRLAKDGVLLPTDLLWREGMKKWLPASEARGLFSNPQSATGLPEKPLRQGDDNPTSQRHAPQNNSFASRMQQAARITMLTAEKTKIATVSLPAAYVSLGRQLYSSRQLVDHVPDVFAELDQLHKAIEYAQDKAFNSAGGSSLSDKAKGLAMRAGELAKAKNAEVRTLGALARLGQAAATGNLSALISGDLLAGVQKLHERMAVLDAEMSIISKGKGDTQPVPEEPDGAGHAASRWTRRFGLGFSAIVALAILGGFMVKGVVPKSAPTSEGAVYVPSAPHQEASRIAADVRSLSVALPKLGERVRAQHARPEEVVPNNTIPPDATASGSGEDHAGNDVPTTSPGPTTGEMQMAEAALRDLHQEQKLLPLSPGGPIGLLPPIPRIRTAVPTYTTPDATHDSGSDRIGAFQLDEARNACIINDVLCVLPTLTPVSLTASIEKLNRSAFLKTLDRLAGQYAEFEKRRRGNDMPAHIGQMLSQGHICGDLYISVDRETVAVVHQQYGGLLGVDDRAAAIPAMVFWSLHDRSAELVEAVPLAATRGADGHAQAFVLAADAWKKSVVLLTSAAQGDQYGDTLEMWLPSGPVASMHVTKHITSSRDDRPYCLGVCRRTGMAALLYPTALRFVDLTVCSKPNMELAACAEAVFEEPAPSVSSDGHRVLWTPDGQYCVVQRESKNEGVGEPVVLEIYDTKARLVSRLAGVRAAYLGDLAADGESVAVRRSYQPMEGVACSFVEPQEVELLSLPHLETRGKVFTCFAERIRVVKDSTVITGGISARERQGVVSGGWKDQVMNRVTGGNYVTYWDMKRGQPVRRVRDVDVNHLIASDDGKTLLTTRRSLGGTAAMACMWAMDSRPDETEWVDEFERLRVEALDNEKERRSRITLPAPPVEPSRYQGLQDGSTYYEVKEYLGGAGRLSAEVTGATSGPMLVAVAEYDVSDHPSAVYRLSFEGPAKRGNLRVEDQIKLTKKIRVE